MKQVIGIAVVLLGLGFGSIAFACHPDRHFGILVSLDPAAKRFTILHIGDDPQMRGKFFTFVAQGLGVKELKPGMTLAVQFVTEQETLVATKVVPI